MDNNGDDLNVLRSIKPINKSPEIKRRTSSRPRKKTDFYKSPYKLYQKTEKKLFNENEGLSPSKDAILSSVKKNKTPLKNKNTPSKKLALDFDNQLNLKVKNTPSKKLALNLDNQLDLNDEEKEIVGKYEISNLAIILSPFNLSKLTNLEKNEFKKSCYVNSINKRDDFSSDDEFEVPSASPATERLPKKAKKFSQSTNLLEEAKIRLHTSEVPERLLKRENEYKEIYDFIFKGVSNKLSQALYISGVPGTGKTATVLKVIENLKKNNTIKFDFVSVNALELSNPKRLFYVVYKAIVKNNSSSSKVSAFNAQHKLNEIFSRINKKRKSIVLLVDEVDMLFTKRQEVIYTVFNWTTMQDSNIIIIAISNTLDLFERSLSQRVCSRLGSTRLCFQPYHFDEISEIISHRLLNCSAITKDAIGLASRKVASLSGDLRKALELMRRAIDIAIDECVTSNNDLTKYKLTINHVNMAIRESTESIRMNYVKTMSKHEELIFRALVFDLQKSNLEETVFRKLLDEYKEICHLQTVNALSACAVFRLLLGMAESHFVSISSDGGQMNRRIALYFPLSEAQFCIRQLDLNKNDKIAVSV